MSVPPSVDEVRVRLQLIVAELESQPQVRASYTAAELPFAQFIAQLHEWVDDVDEVGIAFESVVVALEVHPYRLSGLAAIALLETGLLLGYKTTLPRDAWLSFETRPKPDAAR